MSISDEITQLSCAYREQFGVPPPVHEHMFDIAPSEAIEMIRRALERGTPIATEDYPLLPPGVVY